MALRLWVLGASDPERERIAKVLSKAGEKFVLATVKDEPVHPGSAYRADPVDGATHWIECSPVDGIPAGAVVIDHHRPGDPGYSAPPADYWRGSSLGQVMAILGQQPTEEDKIIAAADHCLAAAYQGLCPGVDPDALGAWRVRSRAAYQGRSEDAVRADIEKATGILVSAHLATLPCPVCGDFPLDGSAWAGKHDCYPGEYTPVTGGLGVCGDLHHWVKFLWPGGSSVPCGEHGISCDGNGTGCWGDIPELPEAAMRAGIAYLAFPRPGKDGQKVVLGGAAPATVRWFLAGGIPGLVRLYGSPARGFAGGYCA